jgi:hypothetical protein
MAMASVVFTPQQITQIATFFGQKQFVEPNATAVCGLDQLKNGISTLAMSISIGGGTVSYSPAFTPPVSNMTLAQQSALIGYIIQMAMGVPLV